jgi:hypothetical protein
MKTDNQQPITLPHFGYGIDEAVILVRIIVVQDALTPLFYPPGNRSGSSLLCSLLRSKVEAAGVSVLHAGPIFDLNRSFYLFTLELPESIGPALAAIKKEITAQHLQDYAQIAWNDPREGVRRLYHPQTGEFLLPSAEEREAEQELYRSVFEALRKRNLLPPEDGTVQKTTND